MTDREISLKRAEELKKRNAPFEEARKKIEKGSDDQFIKRYNAQKEKIIAEFECAADEWDNWTWQIKNRVSNVKFLSKILNLGDPECDVIEKVSKKYRWAITPYYLALINPADLNDPVRLMSIPGERELNESGCPDPMCENQTNPAGNITQRYPDRLILNITNACAMFCRHCQRRRKINSSDSNSSADEIKESIQYIRDNSNIRDVIITGGDPLALPDSFLEELLSEIRKVKHVEIIRIGSRTPVTMPQRITASLAEMIKKYHPVYFNSQFNHPHEITLESIAACNRLSDAGIPLGNQMVLLNGVNNDKFVVQLLNNELLKMRVRPYYIFHAKQVVGTVHFHTTVDDDLEIMEYLRGHASGLAIPAYVINAPEGQGKIPLLPQYIIGKDDDFITMRTWEGNIIKYPNEC
ncbi:MAG: KamA family radical SAM protein [Treponema sp.]|jgi:lysine 2,3-aminomutase|nr:KamA family radical SAM protein [Treponema sp.]